MLFEKNNNEQRTELSLLELNSLIRDTIRTNLSGSYWIRAEMADVRVNASSGHCYLEFIEKNEKTGQLLAKSRGTIWANNFRMIKPYFERITGQSFASGIKVLVKVTVDFHELYGFNITVQDIDPSYTLGDIARKRLEIINRLKKEGVFTLNKELPFPTLPLRIALITSPTAAGYEDFMNQLTNHEAGYGFIVKLFPAIMQGEKTESSVIHALEQVFEYADLFDVVAVIRGGGSTADLNWFDSYFLAASFAQFPLPIITGIGHERDDTILDMVAHTRMKTPTAVAEFLISSMDKQAELLAELEQRIVTLPTTLIEQQRKLLHVITAQLPGLLATRIERNRSFLGQVGAKLTNASSRMLNTHVLSVNSLNNRLHSSVTNVLADKKRSLDLMEQFITMSSPQTILAKGYTLTLMDGRIVKRSESLKNGDEITTLFMDGKKKSIIVNEK